MKLTTILVWSVSIPLVVPRSIPGGLSIRAGSNDGSSDGSSDGSTDGPSENKQRRAWDKCFARGQDLSCLLAANKIEKARQTKYTNFEDLEEFGWSSASDKAGPDDIASTKQALADLSLPQLTDASWKIVVWTHDRDTEDFDGTMEYPVS